MGGQLKSVSLPRAPGINVFKPFRLPLWKTGDTPGESVALAVAVHGQGVRSSPRQVVTVGVLGFVMNGKPVGPPTALRTHGLVGIRGAP